MSAPLRVLLIGFPAAEVGALGAMLRADPKRTPHYATIADDRMCDLVIADADHADSLAEVVRLGLTDRTVYIGNGVPDDAPGWIARPVAVERLLGELDALAEQHQLAAASPVVLPTPAAPPLAETRPPRRVLIVDDSDVAQRYLELRLQPHPVVIDKATTSAKAIDLISQRAYYLVFLDVELGPASLMDGLALCQHIKRHHHHAGVSAPVVVIVSAHHSELDRARGALAGCDAYLAKPIDEEPLLQVLIHHDVVPGKPRRSRY